MYEIVYLDGLYCVFRNSRIVLAAKTEEDARKAIKRMMKGEARWTI